MGLWLIDVRKVNIDPEQALRYYREEGARLKLREFRAYELGKWDGFGDPPDARLSNRPNATSGVIVIRQYITSDSKL
jgi:hypothetical protein